MNLSKGNGFGLPDILNMSHTGQIVLNVVLLVAGVGVAVWGLALALRRSEDPPRLILKWIGTVVVVGVLFWKVVPIVVRGEYVGAFMGIPLTAVCGLALAIIWRTSLASMIAKPFSSIYDGGDQKIEPRPLYSMALAKRNRGKYTEAVAEIRKQLDQFPDDFDGQLLLAEIQAENLNDLPGAEITIQRLCGQAGRPPGQIALALNYLADWHLKLTQDREAAKQDLERIMELLPDSEFSARAAQRIGHLADTDYLLSSHDRERIAVKAGVQNIGLLSGEQHPKTPEADPARQAVEYVKHLQEHPLDTEAREQLAILYADHYGRLDLAADQLEQLIAHPNQPPKRVVHWLNLLADLQIRHAPDYETARQTLQRIVDRFPNLAAAQNARDRLNHLKLELKGKEKSQTVQLGSYEQDIGLKRGSPYQL